MCPVYPNMNSAVCQERAAPPLMLDLKLMALRCIKDASPVHCSRPDIQRIPARCDLEWPQKGPGIFEGRRSWGKELRISRATRLSPLPTAIV